MKKLLIWKIPFFILAIYRLIAGHFPLCKEYRAAKVLMKSIDGTDELFKRAVWQWAIKMPSQGSEFVSSYRKKLVEAVRINDSTIKTTEPILICAVRDDLHKVKKQIEYHSKIGISNFAYIDNNSTDGTYEWLLEQEGISLFRTDERFSPTISISWRKQVMDIFGYERWYLVIDSDEFFCYPGMERISINKYIEFIEEKGYQAAFAPLLDMYPKGDLFLSNECSFDESYNYFDTDSYMCKAFLDEMTVKGGPRARVLLKGNEFNLKKMNVFQLKKFPLLYALPYTIPGIHENFPYQRKTTSKKPIAFLLHYKLTSRSEIEKFKEYLSHGKMERAEMEVFLDAFGQNQEAKFYYEGSEKLSESTDLCKIRIYDSKFFGELMSYYDWR